MSRPLLRTRDYCGEDDINIADILTQTWNMVKQVPTNEAREAKKSILAKLADIDRQIAGCNMGAGEFRDLVRKKMTIKQEPNEIKPDLNQTNTQKDDDDEEENDDSRLPNVEEKIAEFRKDYRDIINRYTSDDLRLVLVHEVAKLVNGEDISDEKEGNEEDDIESTIKYVNKDPVTKKKIEVPLKNKFCGHVYDEASIKNLLEGKDRIDCPVLGCHKKKKFNINDLDPFPEFFEQCED